MSLKFLCFTTKKSRTFC